MNFLEDFWVDLEIPEIQKMKFLKNDEINPKSKIRHGRSFRYLKRDTMEWFVWSGGGWVMAGQADKHPDTQPARHLTWLHKSSRTHQKRAKNARKSFVFKAKTDLTLLPASPKKRRIVQKSFVFKAKTRFH
jgi:hypothetical protein